MNSRSISLDAGGASCYKNLNTKGKPIRASLSLGRRLDLDFKEERQIRRPVNHLFHSKKGEV